MKNIICKIFGHNLKYNSLSNPTKSWCKRCDKKFKLIVNQNPKSEYDLTIWKEIK